MGESECSSTSVKKPEVVLIAEEKGDYSGMGGMGGRRRGARGGTSGARVLKPRYSGAADGQVKKELYLSPRSDNQGGDSPTGNSYRLGFACRGGKKIPYRVNQKKPAGGRLTNRSFP